MAAQDTFLKIPQGIALSLGTAAAPSYSFIGDDNTGFYSFGADEIGVSTGGIAKWRFRSSGDITPLANNTYSIGSAGAILSLVVTNGVRGGDGTVGNPAYTFSSGINKGMWSSAANTLDFATAGINRWSMNGTILSSGSTSSGQITLGSAPITGTNQQITIANPGGTSIVINNSNAYAFSGHSIYWTSDAPSFCDIGRLAFDGTNIWGRPKGFYSKYRVQVNPTAKVNGDAQDAGSLYVKNRAAASFGVLSTANASTTITGVSQNDGILRNVGVGDYIQLAGLATYGKVTSIPDNTTIIVDTPLGDGASRQINLTTDSAVFEADTYGITLRLSYDNKAIFGGNILSLTDGGISIGDGSTADPDVINAKTKHATRGYFQSTQDGDPGAQTDSVALGAKDSSDTARTYHMRTEQAVATDAALVSTHSLKVWINGVEYKISLTAV